MTSAPSSSRFGWIFPAIATLAIFIALYFYFPYASGYGEQLQSLYAMMYALSTDYGSWGHCMLVFPIVAGIIYWKREELAEIPIRGSLWGMVPLILSMAFYWVGYKAGNQYVGFISAQIFLAGVVIFMLGWRFFQAILFPWAFLAFAWPFIFLDAEIAFPLRVKMSVICFRFLNLIGIPTLLDGTGLLSAPDYVRKLAAGQQFRVDIADPCSGIRSLFALTMITALYGYLTLPKTWQKIALFLMAIPLAILGNFFRILILTFGTLWFGSEFAIGSIDHPTWFHMGAGYFVYIIALGGMVVLGGWLGKAWLKKKEETPV